MIEKVYGAKNKQLVKRQSFRPNLVAHSLSSSKHFLQLNTSCIRVVEAVIFQPLPHLSLPLSFLPLPLPLTKNEKTTIDKIFELLSVCSLPSSTL